MNLGVSCPFPFSDQPGVPQREKYIAPGVLKTLSSRKSNAPGALPPIKQNSSAFAEDGFSEPAKSFQPVGAAPQAKPTRTGSVWGGQASVNGFDRTDIGILADHMIRVCNEGSDIITMAAFDSVFKKFAAQSKSATAEEHARRALCTFELFLQFRGKSLYSWFKAIDTVGKGSISHFKFQHCLKELAFEAKQPLIWSEAEIHDLTDFVCNGTNDEISIYTFESAFERMHLHNANAGEEAVVGSLLSFLRGIMKRERIRVVDLFHHMDETHESGVVTREQLVNGLKALILHPHDLRLRPAVHESASDMYYHGTKKTGDGLRPVLPGLSKTKSSLGVGVSPATSPKKGSRGYKKSEEQEFVKLMRDSQQYLDAKVDAFNKKDTKYKSQVKQGVKKYINVSMKGYDRHIDTDLKRLLKL